MHIRKFSFYLLPHFSLQSLASAVEALRLANEVVRRTVYEWEFISIDGQDVTSNAGLPVSADIALRNVRERDRRSVSTSAAVVCGGAAFPSCNSALEAWLRACGIHGLSLVGIASGSAVLARAGVADGRRCAIHWEQLPLFLEAFPTVVAIQTAFEQDGELHTCPGGDAPFDMFLRFVERDHGKAVVNRICAKAVVCRTRSAGDRQRTPLHSRVNPNHRAVIAVIERMEASVANPVSVSALVAPTRLSRRQIERLFEREMGRSPSRYYLEVRLQRGHLLLVTSRLSVMEISLACGFASASHFSKVYRDAFGCNPNQTRLLSRENDQNPSTGSSSMTPMASQPAYKYA